MSLADCAADWVTVWEVNRQRTALVKALEAVGWVAPMEHAQVTVLQYNPPYTLPTVRRNDVVLKLDGWGAPPPPRSLPVVIKLDGWGAPPGSAASAWTTDEKVEVQGVGGAPQNAFQEDAWKSGGVPPPSLLPFFMAFSFSILSTRVPAGAAPAAAQATPDAPTDDTPDTQGGDAAAPAPPAPTQEPEGGDAPAQANVWKSDDYLNSLTAPEEPVD
ncbi:hypothetical protein T484DRAFT_1858990 [Baffinella frigidus]|nr:hypothetical protein T484DRAFT_1858990 [Cryptophyta sp. CCMP2293]